MKHTVVYNIGVAIGFLFVVAVVFGIGVILGALGMLAYHR